MGLKALNNGCKSPIYGALLRSTGIYARVGWANNVPKRKTYPPKGRWGEILVLMQRVRLALRQNKNLMKRRDPTN